MTTDDMPLIVWLDRGDMDPDYRGGEAYIERPYKKDDPDNVEYIRADAAAEREAKLVAQRDDWKAKWEYKLATLEAATLKIEGLERENRTLRQAMVRLANLSFPNGMRDRFKEDVNDIAAEALKDSEASHES